MNKRRKDTREKERKNGMKIRVDGKFP